MNRPLFLLSAVLLYGYSTSLAASTCNEFRTDLQTIQQQVRQIEFGRSTTVLNSVQQAGQAVKASCLDQLSSLDMTSFGFTPGAASMITKLANQACQRLSQELSQRVGEVQQKAVHGINGAIDGANIPGLSSGSLGGALGGGGLQPSMGMNSEPTVSKGAMDYVAGAWDRLKNFILP